MDAYQGSITVQPNDVAVVELISVMRNVHGQSSSNSGVAAITEPDMSEMNGVLLFNMADNSNFF